MSVAVAVKLAGSFAAFVLAVVLARMLGPVEYGVYAYAFAVAALLGVPVQLGIPQLVVRHTAVGAQAGDTAAVRRLWTWALCTTMVCAIVIVGLAAVVAHQGFSDRESALSAFYWALALIPLIAVCNIAGAALRGLGRMNIGLAAEFMIRPSVLVLLVIAVFAAGGTLDARSAMILHVVAAAGAVLYAWKRVLRTAVVPGISAVGGHKQAGLWRSALALGLVAAAHLINTRADILVIGALMDAGSVGIYQVAVSGSNVVMLGASAAAIVAAPQFARLHAAGRVAEIRAVARGAARFALALTLPAAVALAVFGRPLVSAVFGADYMSAHVPLTILVIGQLINTAFGPVAALLNMANRESITAKGVAASAVVNIVLNLLLVPTLGIAGAAIATAVSVALWNLLLWRAARKLLAVDTSVFARIKV